MLQTKEFLGSDFLLANEVAQELYHRHAAVQPIIDYHNHLSPKDIADNRMFQNLTEAWLEGDHYKWRAMRTQGVDERYCTGPAPPEEKFVQWAATVPHTLRNPLFHWTHLELKNYFGITTLLNADTASDIYHECTALLQTDEYRVQGLLARMNVEVVCTTDDPTDTLQHHSRLATSGVRLKIFPTFRPDKAYAFHDPNAYRSYLNQLADVSGVSITSVHSLLAALEQRMEHFAALGCCASDHGLEQLPDSTLTATKAENLFQKVAAGQVLPQADQQQLRGYILLALCEMYHSRGWVQQFHLGALRNNNTRRLRELGADTGFDSIGDFEQARPMARFLDHLDSTHQLARTILYNLNPADNELFATMAGNFNDGSIPGKMQYGSAWWFLDQKDGIEKQLNALSSMGLLARFIGMVTDSRSFLSFPRHEYFRRILCNLLGQDVERGDLPDDRARLGALVEDICYHNVRAYFPFSY